MDTKQVITISPDGTLSGLQHRRGFDLRKLGEVSISRASEVLWDEDHQRWFVEFRDAGSLSGQCMTATVAFEALGAQWDFMLVSPATGLGADKRLLFAEYDDAVHAEITVLNAMRLAGQL